MNNIESKLALVLYQVDQSKHIKVNTEICQACQERYCLYVCPAGCFTLVEDKIEFAYEGCLECGACDKACEKSAISWNYPRGGFGVCFRYG